MFGPLKQASHGRRFAVDEVLDAVHIRLRLQLENFFADGITRLINHYTICVKRGDYYEKLYTSHLSQNVIHKVINTLH